MGVVDIVEEINCTYVNAANGQEVTFTYGIERTKTDTAIKNKVGHGTTPIKTGLEPSNEDKDNFAELQDDFLSGVSYSNPHGTIYGRARGQNHNYWRIDQQNQVQNNPNFFNLQFQVDDKTFANVVVYPKIVPKQGENINMDMKVFPKRKGLQNTNIARPIKRVHDVEELDSYREEESRIKMAERVNKYVGEALRDSLNNKLKYEIRIVLLEQK